MEVVILTGQSLKYLSNNDLETKVTFKSIVTLPKGNSVDITIPFNSMGFLVFNGGSNSLQSLYQYFAFSNGISARTIGTQGSNVAYTIKSGTNVLTVKNNDSSNTLVIYAIILYGESPVLV